MRESRPGRFCLHLLFALTCLVAVPASASAVCTVPGATDATMDPPAQDFDGTFDLTQQGAYVQIPFNVPMGTTGIRVRYCFDNPGNVGNTLDIGVYEPKGSDPFWGQAQRRGWSGSAVRDLGIGVNGFTGEATYLADKKAYVSGRTTRAYQPGPIPAGTWAVELGLASIVTPTVDWALKVETTDDASWSNAPYEPVAYDTTPAGLVPGWYTGDLHVHGEQEPGNATVEQTLDHGFGSLSSGGGGLDFVTLVDHNNDIAARGDIGRHQPAHPGKLIIPGTEVTTYRGHWNNQGPGAFADFRMGPILDAAETQVRGPATPAAEIAAARSAASFTQINHPTTFPSSIPAFAALCRGCPWDYSAADTQYANVDAIEIQNGPVNFGGGPNPFTPTAIDFYEGLLAEGHHIAAVGSSDAHQGSSASATSAAVGGSATAVFASELSRAGIAEGVREDHTYVKLFGASGPDIRVTARIPSGARRTLGHSLAGPALELTVRVLGAGPGAARPGTYELQIQRNGNPVATRPISGDDFTAPFTYTASGRYSVLVLRKELPQDRLEVYSTPVWFTRGKPSNRFSFGRLTRNRRAGTALLRVRVPSAGRLVLFGKGLRRRTRGARRAGTVKLPVRAMGAVNRRLIRDGTARVRIRVRYRPNFGDPRTRGRPAKLVRRD